MSLFCTASLRAFPTAFQHIRSPLRIGILPWPTLTGQVVFLEHPILSKLLSPGLDLIPNLGHLLLLYLYLFCPSAARTDMRPLPVEDVYRNAHQEGYAEEEERRVTGTERLVHRTGVESAKTGKQVTRAVCKCQS